MPVPKEPAIEQTQPSVVTAASPLPTVFEFEGPSDRVTPDS